MCDQSKRYGSIGKKLPLQIKQGADFRLDIRLKMADTGEPFDSTGFTARAHLIDSKIRTPIAATFPQSGILQIYLPAIETAKLRGSMLLGDGRGSYDWDCEFLNDGEVIPAFYGDVLVFGDR